MVRKLGQMLKSSTPEPTASRLFGTAGGKVGGGWAWEGKLEGSGRATLAGKSWQEGQGCPEGRWGKARGGRGAGVGEARSSRELSEHAPA